MKTVVASIVLVSATLCLTATVPARKTTTTAVPNSSTRQPSQYKACNIHLETAKYAKCMENAIGSALVTLGPGDKSLRVKSLEPFFMSPISAVVDIPMVSLNEKYTNVKVFGLTKGIKMSNFKVDWDKYTMSINAFIPKVELTFNHKVKGSLLRLPLDGSGNGTITMYDMDNLANLKLSKVEKNGEQYLRVNDFKVQFLPKRVTLNFSSLNDRKSKSENENLVSAVNDVGNELFAELKSDFEKAFSKEFKGLANHIFSRVPIKNIFIES